LEAEEEEAGLWPTLGVVRMGHRGRLPLGWMAKGHVAASKPMIGLIGGAVEMVQAVGAPVVAVVVVVVDTMALGVRQDSGVVGGSRWNGPGEARTGGRY